MNATTARQTTEAAYRIDPTSANLKAMQEAADAEMDMVLGSFDARHTTTTYTTGENTETIENPIGLTGQDVIDLVERLGGEYTSLKIYTHELATTAADLVAKRLKLHIESGVMVEIVGRADTDGWAIKLHSGTGSSYGRYYPAGTYGSRPTS